MPRFDQQPDRAYERAESLLRAHLTPEQRIEYGSTHTFCVIGQLSRVPYRILPRTHHNILLNDRHMICMVACAENGYGLPMPLADHMLTHKLYIEHDEERFLTVARLTLSALRAARWDDLPRLRYVHTVDDFF